MKTPPAGVCSCKCHRGVVDVDGTLYPVFAYPPAYLDTIAALQACYFCAPMHEYYRTKAGHRVVPEPSPKRRPA